MMPFRNGIKRISVLLSLVLLIQLFAVAQTLPNELRITVVEGEGLTQPGGRRATKMPAVRVEDENSKPITGATVIFSLPTEGATGEFSGGSKTLAVVTDQSGIAVANGLRFNNISGKVQIHINIAYRGLTARTNVTEYIAGTPGAAKAKGGKAGKIVAILAVAAAAAGGASYAALRNKNGAAAPAPSIPSIGITPGTGSITPPR